jgi:hypothetical protein
LALRDRIGVTLRTLAAIFVALACTVACDEPTAKPLPAASTRAEQKAPSLLEAESLRTALSAVEKQAGPKVEALELDVHPDHLVLKARDRANPARVLQHVYRNGRLEEPVPVRLLGNGKLEENLFSLADADLGVIPALSREAVTAVDERFGKVSHVLLRRNLPQDEDIQFRVYVQSPMKDGYVDADASGKLLGGG